MGTSHLYWILTGPSFAVWLLLMHDFDVTQDFEGRGHQYRNLCHGSFQFPSDRVSLNASHMVFRTRAGR
jgi:hypothetical protein